MTQPRSLARQRRFQQSKQPFPLIPTLAFAGVGLSGGSLLASLLKRPRLALALLAGSGLSLAIPARVLYNAKIKRRKRRKWKF